MEDNHSAPPPIGSTPAKPAARRPRRGLSNVAWAVSRFLITLLVTCAVLVMVRYLVPTLVEDVQYAATRGRQRAEYETAGRMLRRSSLHELSQAYQLVSQRVGPSVVSVNVSVSGDAAPGDEFSHLFGRPNEDRPEGQGSGVIIDPEGYVLTNRHVVRGADRIEVQLSDGRTVPARLVGADALTDLAVLKINAPGLIAAEWGDSDQLEVGGLVWAVGSPFGLEQSITFGILSAKNRRGLSGGTFQDFLQTDAAVNPGNSGGPLVDVEGRVVGINTAIVGQTYRGISFAIPSSVARDVCEQLKSKGGVARGWLGVQLGEVAPETAQSHGLAEPRGAMVVRVVGPTSPAAKVGVQAGDVIVRWNDAEIDSPAMLSRQVAQTEIGSKARLVVLRNGKEMKLQVRVGQRPARLN